MADIELSVEAFNNDVAATLHGAVDTMISSAAEIGEGHVSLLGIAFKDGQNAYNGGTFRDFRDFVSEVSEHSPADRRSDHVIAQCLGYLTQSKQSEGVKA